MALVNEHFLKLPNHYLFSEIAERVNRYRQRHPDADIISLGIGDVTQPLAPAVVQAMHRAVDELASASTFHGYGPEQGYAFLREAIVQHDYAARGIDLSPDEVFVNDGAKSDCGNIGELLHTDNRVAVTDPVYPVYVDTNVMGGRGGSLHDGMWDGLTYLPCTEANRFVPQLPAQPVDIVYLCYPNNPTGTTLTRAQLQRWVDYARQHRTLILYDSAYEAYIQDPRIPHSIYEMEGAREVAIEMRSFSKTAGFTGVRCGYTIVPKALKAYTTDGKPASLNQLWHRRQSTKFNGASYVSQRAAEAVYSAEGQQQVRRTIAYYMENARLIKRRLTALGLTVYGGDNAPYLWVKTPDGQTSWQYFDRLLQRAHVVCTPGVGFGPCGEGFMRLTAFADRERTLQALERMTEARSRK